MLKRIIISAATLLLCAVQTVAQVSRTDSETGVIQAVTLLQFGRLDQCEALLDSILRTDPQCDAAYFYKGRCLLYRNDVAGAVDCYDKAVALDSTNFEYKATLAGLYTNIGQESKAAGLYEQLYAQKPSLFTNPTVFTVLGDAALEDYRDSAALEHFNKALEIDPSYVPALLGTADVYRMRRDLPAFFDVMKLFVAQDEIVPQAKCQYLREVIVRLDGSIYRNYSQTLDSLVLGCMEVHPGDSSALKLAGAWYRGTGRTEQGNGYIRRLGELYPKDVDARYLNLQIDLENNDLQSVIDNCNQMLGEVVQPGDTATTLELLGLLGDSYYQNGDAKSAFKQYDKALRIDPDNILILNNYAYFLSLEGKNLKKALKMSRKTIDAQPDEPTYLDTYGWILHLMGRDAEAKPYFKHAMIYGGKDSKVMLQHYSEVLKALGEDSLSDHYRHLSEDKK